MTKSTELDIEIKELESKLGSLSGTTTIESTREFEQRKSSKLA